MQHQTYFDLLRRQEQEYGDASAAFTTESDKAMAVQNENVSEANTAARNVRFDRNTVSHFSRRKPTEKNRGLEWWPPECQLQPSSLCVSCRAIEFEAAFTTPRTYSNQQWPYKYERPNLSTDKVVRHSDCQFCLYLASAVNTSSVNGHYTLVFHNEYAPDPSHDEVLIKVFPYIGDIPNLYESEDDLEELRSASNTIICHRNIPVRKIGRPQIVSPVFDPSIAKSWLGTCERTHISTCGVGSATKMPKTRLIDCCERKLVSVGSNESYRFVALSYVWGLGPSEPKETGDTLGTEKFQKPVDGLLRDLPLTIEDAITVTKALGFKFLWVDQYCIDQGDHVDKAGQISHMDLIYKLAALTIVAAAGDDCHSGLPGVTIRRDLLDPFVLDECFTFGIHPQNDRQYWNKGRWHTRGWTFQEALLSRRSLVFSDNAIYFECRGYTDGYGAWQSELFGGVECANYDASQPTRDHHRWASGANFESVVGSSTLSHRSVPPGYYLGIYEELRHQDLSESFLQYTTLVSQYTTRNLSYTSDGLNAFRGAANALQHFDHPVFNINGIPFVMPEDAEEGDILAINSFLRGLEWRSEASGKAPEPASLEFPSWCWANTMVWNVTWVLDHLPSRYEMGRVLSKKIKQACDITIEFDLGGSQELLDAFAELARMRRDPEPLSRLKGSPSALCFKSWILNSSYTCPNQDDHHRKIFARVYSDLGHGETKMGLIIPPTQQQSCSTEVYHERLYDDLKSKKYGLVLLTVNQEDATVLLVEWVSEEQGHGVCHQTARRVGICFFTTGPWFGPDDANSFIRCFSIDVDLRLV